MPRAGIAALSRERKMGGNHGGFRPFHLTAPRSHAIIGTMNTHNRVKPLIHSTELSENLRMEGELEAEKSLLVKGVFSGSMESSSQITIARGASVESCTLKASSLSISGRFSGTAKIGTYVELRDGASVSALMETPAMSVSDTSRFEGQIRMPGIGD